MDTETLFFSQDGDRWGLPVFLIHPLGADQRFWQSCRRCFGDGIWTIACDLPGSGKTPKLSVPLTLEQTVMEIEKLRLELGVSTMVIVGCAIGAMAAALYAAEHPESASGLVMSNPAIRITAAAGANLAKRADLVRKNGMMALLPDTVNNAFFGCGDTGAKQEYENRFVHQDPEGYALAALGACGADISGVLGSIKCPVLLVPGGNDKLMPIEHTREIEARIEDVTTVTIEEGAHFIPYQQPVRFGAIVSNFLDYKQLRTRGDHS